jgi:hypothetical protein
MKHSDVQRGIEPVYQSQARAWADGGCDADHGFAFDGVGRPAHWSYVGRPILKKTHFACHALDDLYGQDPVRSSDGFDGMYNEGDSDGLDYY